MKTTMASSRNLSSSVSMSDGSGPAESKPKPPRASVCARITEETASSRQKITQKSKSSQILPSKGKFTANKSEHVEGSSPKKFVTKTDHSVAEKALYNRGNQASDDAANSRVTARTKATKCETDGVLFSKNERQSFLTESMRSSKTMNKQTCENAHDEADTARKASFAKNQVSSVFPKDSQSIENRPLRNINKNDGPTKTKSEAEVSREKEGRIASDDAECARKQHQAHNGRSTVFSFVDTSTNNNNNSSIRGGKMCTGRPSTASGIFGGGAYADDAKKLSGPRMSAAPTMSSDFGDNSMARSRRDAALRGSGGLW